VLICNQHTISILYTAIAQLCSCSAGLAQADKSTAASVVDNLIDQDLQTIADLSNNNDKHVVYVMQQAGATVEINLSMQDQCLSL
jgi:hypothetical protein